MAFDEVRFPTLISWGSDGGPAYNTDVIVLSGGDEKRNENWTDARAQYNVAHTMKTATQLDELITFFRARKGRARGFRFRDWGDYKLEQEVIGTGDGVETDFQIIKTYTDTVSEVRDITKIVTDADANTIAAAHGSTATLHAVRVNSVAQTEGVDYTIDRNTGIITFTSAVTDTHDIDVSGEFDVPVRFDTDTMNVGAIRHNQFNWEGIPLIEVRIS